MTTVSGKEFLNNSDREKIGLKGMDGVDTGLSLMELFAQFCYILTII